MAQYIGKSALVAEIEKQMERAKFKAQQAQENNDYVSCVGWSEHFATCGDILKIINTLEVKEVDLEKEVNTYMDNEMKFLSDEVGYDTLLSIAHYFFELGLKSQKGE